MVDFEELTGDGTAKRTTRFFGEGLTFSVKLKLLGTVGADRAEDGPNSVTDCDVLRSLTPRRAKINVSKNKCNWYLSALIYGFSDSFQAINSQFWVFPI